MYRRADATPQPIIRMHGTVVATMEQMAHLEAVLGDYGGQIGSFEWVFSPRGPGGRPLPMFNRTTGAVDPKVIATMPQAPLGIVLDPRMIQPLIDAAVKYKAIPAPFAVRDMFDPAIR